MDRWHDDDGSWIEPTRRGFQWACCDCGLVHDLDFRVSKGGRVLEFRTVRNERETAKLRKKDKRK